VSDSAVRPDGAVVIALPEDLGRRMRLGPFPSVRHALKFAAYAAVGALVATLAGPIWWLPFLGGGFLLSVHRSEGKGLDERVGAYVAFRLRAGTSEPGTAPSANWAHGRGSYLSTGSGHLLAVLSAGGIPVAFLPPPDARRLFDGFRGVLDRSDGKLYLVAGLEALPARPFLPPAETTRGAGSDSLARAGYREMIEVLCRRRARRRVWVVVWAPGRADSGSATLDRAVRGVEDGLRSLGVPIERLRDHALTTAAGRLGWIRGRAR
jgi:hypothetical protein